MRTNLITASVIGIFIFLCSAGSVYAGFGITPPYLKNGSLTRNSLYDQTIYLVRSDPVGDLRVEVFMDVPGINDWFVVDRGNEFIMERGEIKVPIVIQVQVPEDAEFANYTGAIRIRTSPADNRPTGSGAVSIALGAQVDVDITVIDKEILDFRVRKISISDLNAGHTFGWLYFPGKIRFGVTLENTGNVDVAPSKVTFDIYDISGEELLEKTENSNNIEKVRPFETKQVFAELPTSLPPGNYIARYQILNVDKVKQEGEVNVSIVPYGTLAASGYGFFGLSLTHQASVVVPIAIILLAILYVAGSGRSRRVKAR